MRARSPNPTGDTNPGPGDYYSGKPLIGGVDSLKYTMGERRNVSGGPQNPGPGDYHAKDHLTYERPPAAFMQGSPKKTSPPRDLLD